MSLREFTTSEAGIALMDIKTSPVKRMFVTTEVRMVGKVDYDETKLAYIASWVSGRLDRLYVDYTGVYVKKGDHLVYIYSPELMSAQEELFQAKQAVETMKSSTSKMMRKMNVSTLEAARDKLRLLGLKQEQIEQIEQNKKPLEHLTIYSPASGVIIHRNATEGMYVKTGTRIYTIADLTSMWVILDAYESDLIWIRYGQKIKFNTVSNPGEIFTGTIAFIDPILDSATRTVKVRVNVPNPDGKLKPGMFVKAVVHSKLTSGGKAVDPELAGKWICPMHPGVVKDGPGKCNICGMPLVTAKSLGYAGVDITRKDAPLVIPASAPLVTGTRAVVYVEIPDRDEPTFEGKEIVLGPRAGNFYIVRSGLKEGERVVTRGNFKIDSALQISAKPSMMSPDGGGGGGEHAQHGREKPKSVDDKKPALDIPMLFHQQVQQMLKSADQIIEAESNKQSNDSINKMFVGLGVTIKKVDSSKLQGHGAMVWREYAMRLNNDISEGSKANTQNDLNRIVASLNNNVTLLRKKLGLTHKPQMKSQSKISALFLKQLKPLYKSYFATQAALAEDQLPRTAAASTASANDSRQMKHMKEGDINSTQPEQVWTCSMHPQIKKKKTGKCPICGMKLVPAKSTKKEHSHE